MNETQRLNDLADRMAAAIDGDVSAGFAPSPKTVQAYALCIAARSLLAIASKGVTTFDGNTI